MKRIISFLMAISIVLVATSCDCFSCYKGNNIELWTVALNSLLGVSGFESDGILILEEDNFGRRMFAYNGYSSNGHILAVLISQKTTDDKSYFIDGVNSVICQIEQDYPTKPIDEGLISEHFTKEQLDKLKEENDWNKEIDEGKLFGVKITRMKPDPVPIRKQRKAFSTASDENDFDSGYSTLLATDKNGKLLYYMRGNRYNDEKDDYEFTKSYLVMLDKNGNLIEETGIEELKDLWNYREQLKKFKESNNWSF